MSSGKVRVLVLRSAGTNCNVETAFAFSHSGASVDEVHLERLFSGKVKMADYHIMALPGGFSYGDDIASGRIFANELRLRLGDRLQVKWDIESCPPDALVPPLMLQPLLENAVYHGIEPAERPAEITVCFARRGDQLLIELANPDVRGASDHTGNQMAIANIRERLMLFYDLEARLETNAGDGRYVVRMLIPYRAGGGR